MIKSGKINSGQANMRQQLHNPQQFYQIVIRPRKNDLFPSRACHRQNSENSTD